MLAAVARMTGHAVGALTAFTVDTHVYKNHKDQVHQYQAQFNELMEDYVMKRQVTRPVLKVNFDQNSTLDDFKPENFKLLDYKPKAFIKAPVAV